MFPFGDPEIIKLSLQSSELGLPNPLTLACGSGGAGGGGGPILTREGNRHYGTLGIYVLFGKTPKRTH
jgi:hypothetical protein